MSTIQTEAVTLILRSRVEPRARLVGATRQLFRAFRSWLEKRRSRALLHTLTDDQLLDIGITRQQAEREVSKSFLLN